VRYLYTVSRKNCANLFLSELRQIATNFDNVWQKDGKEAKLPTGLSEELYFEVELQCLRQYSWKLSNTSMF